MSIYDDVKRAGGFIEDHESDLRLAISAASDRILRNYPVQDAIKEICLNEETGELCWCIPLALVPGRSPQAKMRPQIFHEPHFRIPS